MRHIKKLWNGKSVFVVLLMCCLLLTSIPFYAAETDSSSEGTGGNMLADGSFDNAMTECTNDKAFSEGYWTSVSWASSVQEENNAHTGTGVANITYNFNGLSAGQYPGFYQDVAVEKNTIYEVSFYAKNWYWGDRVQEFKYGYRNPNGEDVWASVEEYRAVNIGKEYTQFTFRFDSKDLESVRIFAFTTSMENDGNGGGYHFDDFTMVKIGLAEDDTDDDDVIDVDYTIPANPNWQDDGVLKILSIGNSFSDDSMEYVYNIAEALGVENIVLGNLSIGGCDIDTHFYNIQNDVAAYAYWKNTDGVWSLTTGTKPCGVISAENWDYVTIQQQSIKSGHVESYENFEAYIDTVKALLIDPDHTKIVFNRTWAYQHNTTQAGFADFNNDQMTMYNSISNAVLKQVVTCEKIDYVIPTGTSIQNTRTSYIGDTLTRDGYHLSYGLGRYIAGMTYVRALTGLSIDNISYAPAEVDEKELQVVIESVNNAVETPFAVTQSAHTAGSVEGENLLVDGTFDNAMTGLTNAEALSSGYWTSVSWASRVEEPQNAYEGSGLANLTYNFNGLAAGEYPGFYQDVEVEPNTIYEVSFYVRNWHWDTNRVEHFKYGYRDPNGTDVWASVEEYMAEHVDSGYEKLTFRFDSKALEAVRIFVFATSIENDGGMCGYHFDNFSMIKVGPAEDDDNNGDDEDSKDTEAVENMLSDGSFDHSMTVLKDASALSIGYWTSVSWASQLNEAENAHSGSGVANLVYDYAGLAAGEYPGFYQDVEVEKNTIYEVSFYVKNWHWDTDTVEHFKYGYRNPLGEDVWASVEEYMVEDAGTEYQKISFRFDSKNLEMVRFFVFATSVEHSGNATGGYHFDDFTMVKVGASQDSTIKNTGDSVGAMVWFAVIGLGAVCVASAFYMKKTRKKAGM